MNALLKMLESQATPIDEIAAWLDAAGPAARLEHVFALDRAGQRALYRRAESSPPITLEHFVPHTISDVQPVNHKGRNTLPLPGKHRFFEKRFARPRNDSARPRLFGYNHAPSKKLLGPGYFVAESTHTKPSWLERGGIVVDYFQVPDGDVPNTWPRVIPNEQGLQRFVYKGTRDFMRRVSAHVSIGAAYKAEKALDHYFVLVRQDD
ncbi:MAG TPA: hypothetical protein VFG30_31400 [Polyangiales bacterium]|jgi:hypothetical protein|nr:hypothetical protein [Polyangiales bacterium]